MNIPTFLPGTFTLMPGTSSDYRALEGFHYLRKRPRTWAAVWVVVYGGDANANAEHRTSNAECRSRGEPFTSKFDVRCSAFDVCPSPPTPVSRLAAVGVLSWPTAVNRGRDRAFGLTGRSYGEKIRFANANVRTISRVIVHPQFRSLGLATAMVRCLCEHCPTRYVEASAQMGRAVPMFERAGMTRLEPEDGDRPIYYVLDREGEACRKRHG